MAFTFKHGDRPLEGYVIQRGVGKGGFGEVYYALSDAGKEVALKYLKDNPDLELRGTSNVMNLKNPHLVTVFDVRQNPEGDHFIVMEYVHGPSLRDLLAAEPDGLGMLKAAFFIKELAKGLSYLHDRGIVHRDLKPGNIFYEDGYVKIGDYGLSKFISVSRHSGQTASVGTVHYMAPEVGSGNYHRGIDIYALGVMLYEMLLGRVPFEGSSMGEVLMKHLTEQPEVDQLPAPFAGVLRKALAKDPNERYQTVDEMAQDILEVEEIRNSMAAFKPASLTTAARRMMNTEALDSPHPSPHPPPKPGHVLRHPGWGKQHQAPRRGPRGGRHSPSPEQFSRTLVERLGHRRPADHLHAGVARDQDRHRGRKGAIQIGGLAIDTDGGKWSRRLTILLVTLGLSVAIGMLARGGRYVGFYTGTTFFFTMALIVGVSISARILRRMDAAASTGWGARLITLGCSALPILLVGAVVSEECRETAPLLPAVLLMAGLVNWIKRVQHGLSGRLEFKDAFWAAIVGLVAAAACSEGRDELMLLGAGIGGTASLALQAGALFRRPDLARGGTGSGARGPAGPPEGAGAEADEDDDEEVDYAALRQRTLDDDYGPGARVEERHGAYPEPPSAMIMAPPGKALRSTAARVLAGIFSAGLLIGIFSCVMVAVFEARHHQEWQLQLGIGVVVQVVVLLWSLGKTGRFCRPGWWMGVFRPALLAMLAAGMAACLSAIPLTLYWNDSASLAGVLIGAFACLMCLIVVLFIRRRTPGLTGQCFPCTDEAPVGAEDRAADYAATREEDEDEDEGPADDAAAGAEDHPYAYPERHRVIQMAPPGKLPRRIGIRVLAALFSAALLIGMFCCLMFGVVLFVDGDVEEGIGFMIGLAAQFWMLIWALGKSRRWRRPGLWMGVLRPLLAAAFASGMFANLVGIPLGIVDNDEEMVAAVATGAFACFVFLVIVLAFRSRAHPAADQSGQAARAGVTEGAVE